MESITQSTCSDISNSALTYLNIHNSQQYIMPSSYDCISQVSFILIVLTLGQVSQTVATRLFNVAPYQAYSSERIQNTTVDNS